MQQMTKISAMTYTNVYVWADPESCTTYRE